MLAKTSWRKGIIPKPEPKRETFPDWIERWLTDVEIQPEPTQRPAIRVRIQRKPKPMTGDSDE